MISVYKVGGNVVDDPAALDRFCREFAALEGPKLLVHGGGVLASQVQKALGIEPVKIEGRRVTDAKTLEVVTMVYAGLCNKQIVARLQQYGCNAIGLSGCDGSVITARKRPPKTLSDGVTTVDYGFVGDVTPASVDRSLVLRLLDAGLVPVFCAINHDGRGQLLNTNADTMASSLSAALGAKLFYCFEKNGVLCDVDDEGSVIPELDPGQFELLKEQGRVADGMIPKLEGAFRALRDGASGVVIRSAADLPVPGGTELKL
ncbi:MAG: acetylglutamate kinase [Bacteroidales bacterium]|nr:acetylglutamate kinase [Bacteroidales bacterium]